MELDPNYRVGQRVTYYAGTRLGVAKLPGEIVAISIDGRVTISALHGECDSDDAVRVIATESNSGTPGTFQIEENKL